MKKIKGLFLPGSTKASYADAADFLRFASVGMIGWYHIWQQSWLNPNLEIGNFTLNLYPQVACGYMFVDLMLLLSGFLLMLGYLSGRVKSWREFYIARAARILPSYLLCMAIMLFAFALPGKLYGTSKHMWTDILSHLSFTHNLFDQSYRYTHLNGALWTLAVEVQFYLFFPLLAGAFKKKPALTYGLMVAAGWAVRLYLAFFMEDISIYFNRLSAMLDVYANGMMAAWAYKKLCGRKQKAWSAWLNTVLAIASAAAICLIVDFQFDVLRTRLSTQMGQMILRYPLSLLGGVLLVCGSRGILLLRRLLSNPIVRFLSGISFNFYIWHQFLAVNLKAWRIPPYAGENPNQAGLMPWQMHYTIICFAAAILAAVLITYLVEKPCGRLIKAQLSRKEA